MILQKLTIQHLILIILAFGLVVIPGSFDFTWLSNPCYAQARIGYDSVINARLGVPPEHALRLAEINDNNNAMEIPYSTELLNTILNAYLWDESAYDYSLQVYDQCTQIRHH